MPYKPPDNLSSYLLNILIELSRMLSDESKLAEYYQKYLDTLTAQKLDDVILTGGYSSIDTSVTWKRNAEAGKLLDLWLHTINGIKDTTSIQRFADRAIGRGDLWGAVTLLDELLKRQNLSTDTRLEMNMLRFIALKEMQTLLAKRGSLKESPIKAQANWVSSFLSADDVTSLVSNFTLELNNQLKSIHELTPAQQNLKTRINKLSDRIP